MCVHLSLLIFFPLQGVPVHLRSSWTGLKETGHTASRRLGVVERLCHFGRTDVSLLSAGRTTFQQYVIARDEIAEYNLFIHRKDLSSRRPLMLVTKNTMLTITQNIPTSRLSGGRGYSHPLLAPYQLPNRVTDGESAAVALKKNSMITPRI